MKQQKNSNVKQIIRNVRNNVHRHQKASISTLGQINFGVVKNISMFSEEKTLA